jgi:hypothetical protein
MTWKIEWREDGSGVATHSSGLQLRVARSGWATVMESPPEVSEIQATVLMAELQRLLADEEAGK